MNYILVILGLFILIMCGDFLVKGAVNLAIRLNIPPLIIGLTVVSIGTSAPELFASLEAVSRDKADMSVGNVVGSNIANLALVLGLTTLIFPVAVKRSILRNEWLIMMLVSILFVGLSLDGQLSAIDGIIMVILLAVYLLVLVFMTRRNKNKDDDVEDIPKKAKTWPWIFFYVAVGFAGLYFGAEWLIEGATGIAKSFGVSDFVIGVTIVAFGTSVPELAASATAALKKESDISIGNLIGSNVFNVLGVLGVTASVHPLDISDKIIRSDFIWMLAVAAVLFPMIYFTNRLSRYSGLVLFGSYLTYVVLLFIQAKP